ncbi:hypothetical protein VIGAN_09025300, partial [Vigna angularis var. angularis]
MIGTLWKLQCYGTFDNVHVGFFWKTCDMVPQKHLLVPHLCHLCYSTGFLSFNSVQFIDKRVQGNHEEENYPKLKVTSPMMML